MDEDLITWFCAYTPLELLTAAGLKPVRSFGDPDRIDDSDAFLHPAICPYVRSCLAQAMQEEGPHHAVFVNSCDGMRRLHDAWKDLFPDGFVFLLDLPRNVGKSGERMLAGEYRHLLEALRSWRGREISHAEIKAACRAREELRREYIRAAEGAGGGERLLLARHFQSAPQDAASPAATRGPAATAPGAGRGVPVLLTGNILNPAGMVSLLEEAGARVVWADLCNGDRAFAAPTLAEGESLGEVLGALAAAYLARPHCARMLDGERRHRTLVENALRAGARGIIYASLKFCDSYLYEYPRTREMLQREGIPVLRLESDYADGHAGQVLTRVEAFLEMIS
ncbi:MAG: 2-hydroxyacyl-CoA dehydratase [Actinobacteria bacterium]|nr:2-hydroxyacyl-CoA dehydratase [Actinomycetota bacterium]